MRQKINLYKILADRYEAKKKYFEDYLSYAKKIKEKARGILGAVGELVFGSIVKGNYGADSDIDILIISNNLPESLREQVKMKLKIKEDFPLAPFEIHFATPQQYECWYKKFIRDCFIEV